MCAHGQTTDCLVPMPACLSHTGEFRWAIKGVDSCIAPLVNALNAAGLYTANCCCGHGEYPGEIILHDGRVLEVQWRREAASGDYVSTEPLTPEEEEAGRRLIWQHGSDEDRALLHQHGYDYSEEDGAS